MWRIGVAVRRMALPTLVVVLGATGCASASRPPADSYQATATIDGQDSPHSVVCTQREWLWTIETEPPGPGFTVIVETGGTVKPRLVRIRDLQGFTGSTSASADFQATMTGPIITVDGTAHGAFADRPVKAATVPFRLQARC